MYIPKFTENCAKNEVLLLLAYTVHITKALLLLVVGSYSYLTKVLRELKAAGLITLSKTRPQIVGLTAAGLELIRATDIAVYEHYMKISANHHPGSTPTHKERYAKAALTITQMYVLDVAVGSMKPALCEVMESGYKLPSDFLSFYQNKEILYSDVAKIVPQGKSRSVGMLFAPAFHAVAYVAMPDQALSQRTEYYAHMLAGRTANELYGASNEGRSKVTLVLGSNDTEMAKLLRSPRKIGKLHNIAAAVWDQKFTGCDVLYVPANEKLRPHFFLAMHHPHQKFALGLFGERACSKGKVYGCDAYTDGCFYYEFVTFNVSKLARAKKICPDMRNVRVICWPEQREFVAEFLELNLEEASKILLTPDAIPCEN